MSQSPDLLYANLVPTQGSQNLKPNTIASTTTIAPTSFITLVTGTIAIATITPPIQGQHQIVLIFTNASPGAFATTGNLTNTLAPTQNLPVILLYEPNTAKYFVK